MSKDITTELRQPPLDSGDTCQDDMKTTKNNGRRKKSTCESYGVISIIGRRREMEDRVTVKLGFLNGYDFFGVYDGHGGARVARACRERLHCLVQQTVQSDIVSKSWEKVMVESFGEMDEEVNVACCDEEVVMVGSTAVVVVVGKEEVVVANCGDSRVVVSRGGVALPLSSDHKPNRPDERERIEAAGGRVINWNGYRVLGVLATSRSIGDQYLKPFVTSNPEVKVIPRTESDEFMIVASDGLWDVVSNESACQIASKCFDGRLRRRSQENRRSNNHASEAALMLAELAIARGSQDNISVIVVEL